MASAGAAGTVLLALIPLLAILGPLIAYMVIGVVVGEVVGAGLRADVVRILGT